MDTEGRREEGRGRKEGIGRGEREKGKGGRKGRKKASHSPPDVTKSSTADFANCLNRAVAFS